jgi:hypothetical protein
MNNKTFFGIKQRMKCLACQREGYIFDSMVVEQTLNKGQRTHGYI